MTILSLGQKTETSTSVTTMAGTKNSPSVSFINYCCYCYISILVVYLLI